MTVQVLDLFKKMWFGGSKSLDMGLVRRVKLV